VVAGAEVVGVVFELGAVAGAEVVAVVFELDLVAEEDEVVAEALGLPYQAFTPL
jgi:hypothetical protein